MEQQPGSECDELQVLGEVWVRASVALPRPELVEVQVREPEDLPALERVWAPVLVLRMQAPFEQLLVRVQVVLLSASRPLTA
ncbi:MAG TPA: hypothetical protein DCG12_12475 [Planctomycetaceae bacterium]|nr:hypothetical protein [Planctomycetaceae bacterium]